MNIDGKSVQPRGARWLCLRFLATLVASVCALNGCGSLDSYSSTKAQQKVLTRALNRGYDPVERHSALASNEPWALSLGAETLQMALLAPADGTAHPLVIYLPGLGEPVTAGHLWREAWARAGQVVLSLQPASLAEALKRPELRAFEANAIAHGAFAESALMDRSRQVALALAAVRQRASAGDPILSRVDFDRISLIGFDLGAQTVIALAGELGTGKVPLAEPIAGLRSAIALSPFVNIARGGLAERFTAIKLPVLEITGTDDNDAFGLVHGASARRALWQGLPPGDKYLLLTNGGNHALLSGNDLVNPPRPPWALRDLAAEALQEIEERNAGANRGDNGNSRSRGGGPSFESVATPTGNRSISANAPGKAFDGRHLAAIIAVSCAFLDTTLRSDPIAREWLTRDAQRWLDDAAQLQSR